MNFQDALDTAAQAIGETLSEGFADTANTPVADGMVYASDGGKRLRGFLVLESSRLHGVEQRRARWAAAAVECLHAYSLVHDDLPSMDDDDLRRGRPTVHRKWDEATALLVGDALQTLAFDMLSRDEVGSAESRISLISSLAKASGIGGMVLGQAQDIAAETSSDPLGLNEIIELQRNKTGALIRWSAEAGPRLAGDDPDALGRYARALGLAFQIADDILDVEGDPSLAGKALNKDEAAGKATFVSLLGLDAAKARAKSLVDEACSALDPYGQSAENLRQAAAFAISRRY